jgi:hypothetical protein
MIQKETSKAGYGFKKKKKERKQSFGVFLVGCLF